MIPLVKHVNLISYTAFLFLIYIYIYRERESEREREKGERLRKINSEKELNHFLLLPQIFIKLQ